MKMKKRLLDILFSLVLVLGLMPGMSLTAYADGTTYNPALTYTGFGDLITNDTEVTISEVPGKTWYVIANDSSTVTLLSKQSFANQAFNSDKSKGNNYETSDIKKYVDGLTGEGQPLEKISSVISDLTLIDKSTAEGLSENKRKGVGANWWLCSQGNTINYYAAFVNGVSGDVDDFGCYVYNNTFGVRPALKLDLSSVIFDSESKEFSLKPAYRVTLSGGANATIDGATSQTGLTGAMTTVTYTANTGYYFAEFPDITNNGITAKRTSSTVVTVSGTPTADAAITVPGAVEKTAATVTKAPTAKSLTYTGSAQDLVTAGEATGGTMNYAIGTDDKTAPTGGWNASIPTATEVGTYYVWYRVVADNSHKDVAPVCMTVTINKKAEVIDKDQKTTTLSKPKAGKKSFTLEWKKQTQKGIKGYEIQYALNKNFTKDAKTVSVNKAKTTSKTIKKLKSGKKYYVRIRTFTKKNGEKVYSKWSKTKSVKVK